METAVKLFVSGQVQDVGYRYWTRYTATRLDLRGWVRNLADGRVEILAIGRAADIDKLVDDCRIGPSAAVVKEVQINDIQPPVGVNGFEIHA